MAKERLHCELHGGYFNRESARGRKPTVCGGKNEVCNKADVTDNPVERETLRDIQRGDTQALKRAVRGSERKAQPRNASNPSLDKGKAAKELLEAQGWTVAGKAWVTDPPDDRPGSDYWASVTAARGEEMLHIVWMNGEVQDQVYNLWNLDVPSKNGRPNAHLPFDPEEIPDSELAKFLVGVKVTWWNKLGQKEETAVCGKESITIEHMWSGTGDEFMGARIVKFVDAEGGGYRAFRLDQLVKVG